MYGRSEAETTVTSRIANQGAGSGPSWNRCCRGASCLVGRTLAYDTRRVVAYPDLDRLIIRDEGAEPRLAMIDELQVPVLAELADLKLDSSQVQLLPREDGDWYVISLPLTRIGDDLGRVLIAMPGKEMLAGVVGILKHQAMWALVLMLLLVRTVR